jgi:lipoprotein NlpI
MPYMGRGIAGSLPEALADLNQGTELAPKDALFALWLDVVNKRSGVASRLPQAITQIDMTKWPAPVIRLFLGQLTPADVLAAADSSDAIQKSGQVCVANFFSAELALQQGAKEDATRLFRLAAADCPKNFAQWAAAKAELKALDLTP